MSLIRYEIGVLLIAVLVLGILLTARTWLSIGINAIWREWDVRRRPVTEFHYHAATGRYEAVFRKRKFKGEKTSYFYGGPYGILTKEEKTDN